jgi:hypothetical protein
MKRVLAISILLGSLGCADVEEASPTFRGEIEGEVGEFLDSYRLAIETRNDSLLRTLYADDGRFEWIEDGEVRYRSLEEVLAALAGLPSDALIRTEYQDVGVSPLGASGARVAMQFRTVMGEGQSAYEFGGMVSMVLEKGPTGWRIVGGHTSTARPEREWP